MHMVCFLTTDTKCFDRTHNQSRQASFLYAAVGTSALSLMNIMTCTVGGITVLVNWALVHQVTFSAGPTAFIFLTAYDLMILLLVLQEGGELTAAVDVYLST